MVKVKYLGPMWKVSVRTYHTEDDIPWLFFTRDEVQEVRPDIAEFLLTTSKTFKEVRI